MIVKDEEEFLESCLNSAKDFVDEIVIVDTGSTDRTKEIAKKFTDKIYDFDWCDDFSAARNESIRHATKEWILVLDADEVINKNDWTKIKEALKNIRPDVAAFSLIQRNYINDSSSDGNWTSSKGDGYNESKKATGWTPNPIVRIFRNNKKILYESPVHESVHESAFKFGKIHLLNIPIHHYGYLNSQKTKNKRKYYMKLGLKKIKETNNYISYYQLGKEYISQNKLKEAIYYLKKAVEKKKDFHLAWFLIGNIYLMQKYFENAKKIYKKAISLKNDFAPTYANLALVYINEKNYEKAIDYFLKSISLNPKNASTHYNLGLCFKIMGKNDKAYLAFKNAVELDPNYKNKVKLD
jgi:tetratricopeptide (TPR) repeat protein